MKHWVYLVVAIVSEVVATTALKQSDGFSKLIPSAVAAIGYGLAFYMLSLTLSVIPLGISYAIWSGVGIVLLSVIGLIVFKQNIDLPGVIGIVLIVSGVVVINLYSKTNMH